MPFHFGPDIKFDPNIDVPFVCSMSKFLRTIVSEGPKAVKENIKAIAQRTTKDAEEMGLKEALMNDPDAQPGDRVMRQMDLKSEDGSIMLKCFIC
jgi:hypothetical protein